MRVLQESSDEEGESDPEYDPSEEEESEYTNRESPDPPNTRRRSVKTVVESGERKSPRSKGEESESEPRPKV